MIEMGETGLMEKRDLMNLWFTQKNKKLVNVFDLSSH